LLKGIDPVKVIDTLFVTSGDLKGNVVKTLKASDYECIFQENTGRERRIIRFRPYGDEKSNREPEAIAILNEVIEKVNKGKYLIGLTPSDAKPLKQLVNA
jgi:hypothetical protein